MGIWLQFNIENYRWWLVTFQNLCEYYWFFSCDVIFWAQTVSIPSTHILLMCFVQNPPFIMWYQSYQNIKNIKVGWPMYLFNIWEYRSQENVVFLTILQWESSYKGIHIAIFTALFYHPNIFDLSQSIHLNFWI